MDSEERAKLKEKLQHLQTKIHDKRRHRKMPEEDREAIKRLRDEAFNAPDEETRRDIEEEIEVGDGVESD